MSYKEAIDIIKSAGGVAVLAHPGQIYKRMEVEKIIKELVNESQIAKSVYVLKTDRNLSDIFKKEDELSISFGEYLSKKLEIKDSKNLTLGRIYR